MTSISAFIPSAPESDVDRRARERIEKLTRPSLIEAAIRSDQAITHIVNAFQNRTFEPDPEFRWTPKLVEEFTEGVPTELIPMFDSAVSLRHAQLIRLRALELARDRAALADAGFKGTALRLALGAIDPVFIATSFPLARLALAGRTTFTAANSARAIREAQATARIARASGLSAPRNAILAAKTAGDQVTLSRAAAFNILPLPRRFVAQGLVNATIDLPLHTFIAFQDPEFDEIDVAFGAALTFLLGGALGSATGRSTRRDLDFLRAEIDQNRIGRTRKSLRDIEFAGLRRLAMGAAGDFENAGETTAQSIRRRITAMLTPAGKKYFNEQLDVENRRNLLEGFMDEWGLPESARSEIRSLDPDELLAPLPEIGPQPPEPGALRPIDFTNLDPAKAAFTRRVPVPFIGQVQFGRMGPAGFLGTSKSPTLRLWANATIHDPLLKRTKRAANDTAEAWARRNIRILEGEFLRKADKLMAQLYSDAQVPLNRRASVREAVMERAARAIRRAPGKFTQDPVVNELAELMRKRFEDVGDLLQSVGVPGFEKFIPNPRYFTRLGSKKRIYESFNRFGRTRAEQALARAISAGSDDIDEEKALLLAKTWFRGQLNEVLITDLERAKMFGSTDTELLQKTLREVVREDVPDPNKAEAIVQSIVEAIVPRSDSGNIPRGRRRIDMDELYSEEIFDEAGNSLGVFSVEDLLENNAEIIYRRYINQTIREAAIVQTKRIFAKRDEATNILEIPTFQTIKARAEKELREAGVDENTIRRELRIMQTEHDLIRGVPIAEDTSLNQALAFIRAFNFVARGGKFVVAQAGEVGNLAEVGVRSLFTQSRSLRQIVDDVKNGRATPELIEELIGGTGVGTEVARSRILPGFDESDVGIEAFENSALDWVRNMSRVSAIYTGFTPLLQLEKRVLLGASTQNIVRRAVRADFAKGKLGMSKKRLADMGLNEDQWRRIVDQIKKNVNDEILTAGKIDLTEAQMQKVGVTERQLAAISEKVNDNMNLGARGSRKFNMSDKQLQELGFSREQWEGIANGIEEIVGNSDLGRVRIKKLNLEKWQDQEAASWLMVALDRQSTRSVQDGFSGSSPAFANTSLGKTLFQFRKFTMDAWEFQTLHRIQMFDFPALNSALGTLLTTTLFYIAQTHLEAIGRADRKEFLERRLSPSAIAAAAIQRSGAFSPLAVLTDNALSFFGEEPIFRYGRTTGLTNQILTGNPTAQFINSASSVVRELSRAVFTDDPISDRDIQRFQSLIPFGRMFGVQNALDALSTRLPEE